MSKFTDFFDKWAGKIIDADKNGEVQCHMGHTMILMPDRSYKRIDQLKEGDEVQGYGGVNVVKEITRSDAYVEVCRTHVADLYHTPGHPFMMKDGSFLPLRATEHGAVPVMYEDYSRSRATNLTDNELRWLGFYLGDGNRVRHDDGRKTEHKITAGYGRKVDYVRRLDVASREQDHNTSGYAIIFGIRRTEHEELCSIMDKCYDEGGSKVLRIVLSRAEWSSVIEGFCEADGSVCHNSHIITNGSKELLLTIQRAAIACGYTTAVIRLIHEAGYETNYGKYTRDMWRLTLAKRHTGAFLNRIKETFPIGDQPVYNLEVTGDHTYIAENYVVHNCVDVYRQYCTDLGFGHTGSIAGAAKNIYEMFDKTDEPKHFTRCPYSPGKAPEEGNVIVWCKPGSKFGHVALVIWASPKFCVVLEQDGLANDKLLAAGKPQVGTIVTLRDYTGCLGWLKPLTK